MYQCIYICIYVYIYKDIYMNMYIYTCAYTHICIHVYICNIFLCIYIHIYMYICKHFSAHEFKHAILILLGVGPGSCRKGCQDSCCNFQQGDYIWNLFTYAHTHMCTYMYVFIHICIYIYVYIISVYSQRLPRLYWHKRIDLHVHTDMNGCTT